MEFTYQKNNRFFAQLHRGMEPLAARELTDLGASGAKPAFRGVWFEADRETLYRIVYNCRLATRILAPLLTFDCHSDRYLYTTAKKLPWPELFGTDRTFAVYANVSNSRLRHSGFAALRLKDAIADVFRKAEGCRPSVDAADPDVCINLYVHNNRATISLDVACQSLHKRGYRKRSVDAPLQETLAAAILHVASWSGAQPLYDPMCGSGTILSEALMRYCRIPSGYLRPQFGLRYLPDYDDALWENVKRASDQGIRPLEAGLISGSDSDREAIAASRANLASFEGGERVALKISRFQDLPPFKDTLIVCNPPYGVRMGTEQEASRLLKALGDYLKQQCTGSTALIYFGNPDLVKKLGLKPSSKIDLMNGPLKGKLARYEMY